MFRQRKPSPAMVVACVALFVALGGASYAAISLPRNSVGTPQLKKNAVVSTKVKNRSLKALDFAVGQLPSGPQGLQGERGPQGPGAVKIVYSAPGGDASTIVDVAAVGPWTIGAQCASSGVQTFLIVFARGPGTAEWDGLIRRHDDAATSSTSGEVLGPAYGDLFGTPASPPDSVRLAFDIQLHSGSEVATVSLHGLADRRSGTGATGACWLYGTAVPAS